MIPFGVAVHFSGREIEFFMLYLHLYVLYIYADPIGQWGWVGGEFQSFKLTFPLKYVFSRIFDLFVKPIAPYL